MPPTDSGPDPSGGEGFRILGSESIFKGYRVDLDRTTVEGPDGSVVEREIVRHPGAVAIVPVTDAGNVLFVRQYRAAIDRKLLEIPAGTRDVTGEAPEKTALRELEEEVGVKAGRIEELGRFWNSPGFCDEETIVYLATELVQCEPSRDGLEEEYLEVHEVPLDRAEEVMAEYGTLDIQSAVGVALARKMLSSR